MKLRDKYGDFSIYKLNKIIVVISFLIFLISLYFVKNVYMLIIIYLLLLYIARYFDKVTIKFICSILLILLLGFLLMSFVKFNLIKNEIFLLFRIIIKILLVFDYLFILYYLFKNKKKHNTKVPNKEFTFQKLRQNNYQIFENQTRNEIEKYVKEKNITKESDYYKLINDNMENKTKDDLEKYIWLNYLRFYKNQNYLINKKNNIYNFIFLGIHVIIGLLVLFVR